MATKLPTTGERRGNASPAAGHQRLSTCGRCGGTVQRTTLGWQHVTVPTVQHTAEPDDSWVDYDGPRCAGDDCRVPVEDDGDRCEDCAGLCVDCGREVSRPGACFDCQVEDSYVGGLAPRFGAQP